MTAPELISRSKLFNGFQERYRHFSETCRCEMTFSVYLPPQCTQGYRVPSLYWLSGLTADDENFVQKSGAQRFAAQWGIALICPDTSPRGENVPDHADSGLGQGAGFYVDAAEQPWAEHYQMQRYIAEELPELAEKYFPLDGSRSIAGHSMGGFGALHLALNYPERYAAVSAFAPVADPFHTPLARRALQTYLGADESRWAKYDLYALLAGAEKKLPIMVEQGGSDLFEEEELHTETFVSAARNAGFSVRYHKRPGYDHSYYFIASFIDSHIEFHADALGL
ncbi:MAG: S-formylglutathione hydrolase [Neisseria sp.]|nr:S-formylglutathione hydrolase [Neisseria sp.]